MAYHVSEKEAIKELLAYGKSLEKDKRYSEALSAYEEAVGYGSNKAQARIDAMQKKYLKEKNKQKKEAPIGKPFKTFQLALVFVFSFIVVLVLPTIFSYLGNVKEIDGEESNVSIFSKLLPEKEEKKESELTIQIIGNALLNFKEERGYFPNDITDIARKSPENWLSYVPKGSSYVSNGDSFKLSIDNSEITENDVKKIKLTLFPSNNTLSVSLGDDTLYNFLVSSSSTAYTITNDLVVTSRVSKPNGEGSPYGSKGFSLSNGIGIHGTNDPINIGYPNTEGSVAMNNQDIELLYPFISIGTTFSISTDTPQNPIYKTHLPTIIPDNFNYYPEENANIIYNWK